jgi:hypothetical protein
MTQKAKTPPPGEGRRRIPCVVWKATLRKIADALTIFKPFVAAFAAIDPAPFVALGAFVMGARR